jgi:hypothetical protein
MVLLPRKQKPMEYPVLTIPCEKNLGKKKKHNLKFIFFSLSLGQARGRGGGGR